MLKYTYRFHGHGSLRYLYQHGKTVRGRSIAVRSVHNTRRTDSRCAVVITRKVCKVAPRRNRMRRRIYEFLRTHWDHIAPAHDIVISVYDASLYDMPYEELHGLLVDVLQKAGIWRAQSGNHKTDL